MRGRAFVTILSSSSHHHPLIIMCTGGGGGCALSSYQEYLYFPTLVGTGGSGVGGVGGVTDNNNDGPSDLTKYQGMH
jgi:hypothetical protein